MAGVDKVLAKLEKSVSEGNYYEAHQMYHSVCQRHLKQHRTDAAIALVHAGALVLLRHSQVGSAADLASRMLDIYESEKLPLTDENKARIVDIFEAFPIAEDAYLADFLRSALKWTSSAGTCPTGDPALHHLFGSRFFKEQEYYDAENHLVHGTDASAKALGHLAFEWSEQGYCTDKGYFIARSVLQLLAQKKLRKACAAFESYRGDVESRRPAETTSVPFRAPADGPAAATTARNVPVFAHRLANFAGLLLIAVQREAADQFTVLRGEYRTALDVDDYLHLLVDRIAAVWFGLGPKKQPNLIEDLMKTMFSGPPPGPSRPALAEMD
ncbi:hypothetical protein HK405_005361 [Cladochytrium tenue]|nr:hypothetical protein HK405_005361 [Cladochytrium tenue]